MLHYPAGQASQPGEVGAGTHTDYGNLTILATDGVAGLQVQRRDGVWLDAPHIDGTFVCNIGDCLMRWTNDIYISTPHRVLRPQTERYSVAFFGDPNPDAKVEVIPSCLAPGETPRYAPTTGAAYLRSRLDANYEHLKPTSAGP
jgi:isopenicillin N synthase-like dioxygenase